MSQTYIEKRSSTNWLISEIDTSKCLTPKSMYVEFSEAFQFPSSPNEGSLDVLLDFMRDLAWLKEKHIEVILTNVDKAKKRNLSRYEELLRILDIIKKHWEEASTRLSVNNRVVFHIVNQ